MQSCISVCCRMSSDKIQRNSAESWLGMFARTKVVKMRRTEGNGGWSDVSSKKNSEWRPKNTENRSAFIRNTRARVEKKSGKRILIFCINTIPKATQQLMNRHRDNSTDTYKYTCTHRYDDSHFLHGAKLEEKTCKANRR